MALKGQEVQVRVVSEASVQLTHVFAQAVETWPPVRLVNGLFVRHAEAQVVGYALLGQVGGAGRWRRPAADHAALFGLRAQTRRRQQVPLLTQRQAVASRVTSARVERIAFGSLGLGFLHGTFLAHASRKRKRQRGALELKD